MAYLGDPVPRQDAAVDAVEMTLAIVEELESVTSRWRHDGYDLHYGVGLAHGYATLGVIGFDGRFDYTPIGGVVNLAARLCAHAEPGQVLLDHATYARCSDRFPSDPIAPLELKGYRSPTRAYSLRLR
jgi:adenylate cyclase